MSTAPTDPSDQGAFTPPQPEAPEQPNSLVMHTIPTFPTDPKEVGRMQPYDKSHYSDLSDLSDHRRGVFRQENAKQRKKTVSWLVEWLRQERLTEGASCKDTYASKNISKALTPSGCVTSEVGKVGKVGIVAENKDLAPNVRSEDRAGLVGKVGKVAENKDLTAVAVEVLRLRQPASVGIVVKNSDLLPPPWSEHIPSARSERSEGTAPPGQIGASDWQDDEVVEPYVPVPQSIPHDVMAAGLLAASRIRPRVVVDKPRSAADEIADPWAAGVKRLQRMLAPLGFALDRWTMICSDCVRLLEHHGQDMRRLGWSTVDAFGVHPTAPAVAVRCYGLGLLLKGAKVIELTGTGAEIEMPSGARQTFTRTSGTGAVPTWAVEG